MTAETVFGIKELNKVLDELAPKHANNISKAVIHGVASEIAKLAKRNAPKDTGTLRKAIKAKRRRGKPGQPVSDVIITQGRGAVNDGFYWRFVEYGTGGKNPQMARPFLTPALNQVKANLPKILETQLQKKLVASIKREKKKAAKQAAGK